MPATHDSNIRSQYIDDPHVVLTVLGQMALQEAFREVRPTGELMERCSTALSRAGVQPLPLPPPISRRRIVQR